jgi:plastocyanin
MCIPSTVISSIGPAFGEAEDSGEATEGSSRSVWTLEHAATTMRATVTVPVRALRTPPSLAPFHGKVRGSGRERIQGREADISGQALNRMADHVSGDTSVEVEAEDEEDQFYFKPSTIIGNAGQSIVIAVQNEGGVEHTFTIDDQDIDVSLSPEQVREVTVTFPDSGSVEYYCRIHVNLGMRGELKVA